MPKNGFEGRKKALKYLALTSTALIGLGQPSATAAEIWTGTASTDWFTAGNWNPAAVPTSSDDVTLDAAFPHPAVVNAPNAAAQNLFIGTIASYTGSLTITNGGTLSDTAGYLGYASNANGNASVVGAGSFWSNSSDLFLALGTDSTGTLTISNGGVVSDTVGHVGFGQGTGTVTVDGTGSTWTNSGDLYIAERGVGTLDIINGGAVNNATGSIGTHAGSNGMVTVDGAGSTWTNSSHLYVGDQGTGALNISSGGKVSNLSGILGNLAGSTGTATVDGAGSTWANAALAVGNAGFGALEITNGGAVTSSVGYAGYAAGSKGLVTVDGAGSAWTNTSDLFIGFQGQGALTVSNGGAVSNTIGMIGAQTGSVGTAVVTGAGSTWTSSSNFYVGDSGTGVLTIGNGGAVSNGEGNIAAQAGSTGIAFVDGAGSTWTNSSNLMVGDFGNGTLAISHGAVVSNTWAAVGAKAGSIGMVFVDGAGSTWTNSSNLGIGDFGAGTLAISNGGAVSSASGYVGNSAGSTGAVFVDGAGSKWTNSGNLYVGGLSKGTLTISNGGAVSNDLGYLGFDAASTGTATVDGAGSTWTNSGNLVVGYHGTATLAISNGGAVSDTKGYVALEADSAGGVVVDGPGSTWMNSGDLFVGFKGAGTLQVTDGGHVLNQAAILGEFGTATATVTVDGAGSSWSTDDSLTLGGAGHATLSISNGGSADANFVFVGQAATATGAITVDGAGSKWTNKNGMYLGGLGSGTLAVTNGGVASGGTAYMAIATGATGQATVDGPAALWEMHGDLGIGFGGTASVTLSNGGVALVDGVTVIASQAGSTGTLNIGGAAGTAATGAGVLDSATLQFGAGTGTLNFNHTSANNGFAAAINGLGTINQIAGNTKLTGNSAGFTGTTNVLGGGLYVNGSLGGAINVTGGLLGGSGTAGNVTIASGGTFAPGNSIGTINVSNTTFSAGSIYAVEVESGGTSDLISATGAVTIGGGTVVVIPYPDYATGTTYTIVTAAGGVTGAFDKATLEGSIFIAPTLTYDANNVYLNLAKASFASVGLTPNQIATGGGADSLGVGNPLFDAIFALPSKAAAQDAFDQLSGEIHASAKGMLLEDSRFIRDAATRRISAAFGDPDAAALPVMAYGEGGPEMVAADTDRFAVWGQAFGSWGHTGSDGNAAAFDRSTGGLLVGADSLVGDWRVGAIGGYSHSTFDADARRSSGAGDNYHLGLYGGTNWGAIAFRTGAAYSWNSISTKRAVAFNGFADQLSADYDAGTAQVFGELAYKADAGRFKFEPFANLAYVSVHTDGFTEKGGGAALTSASSTINATFTTLGLRASTDLTLGSIEATARGTLGWRHAFGDVTPTSTFAFAGGDAFTIAGVPVARDGVVIDAGFDLPISANATLGLSYTGWFGSHNADNGVKANLDLKF
ncbi:autotransporter domain-containing protein [Mesorhizobium sp. CA7]|uniref:autotransporter domain-containing protein n=1 Tax=Mesorhizobium sp. CA7 TaxID=588501 RepID=UPI001CD00622|nr:autotransporter domain-containing protein [Mesorhizobium sp. CA7]MBZ9816434.1 autotransporter outer membrane beta-barrel domain-containing protein [Mesorhizobium sp. CA7]